MIRWVAVTLVAYMLAGLWVGAQMRPALVRFDRAIESQVSAVTRVLR